jgi:hypothetical protein
VTNPDFCLFLNKTLLAQAYVASHHVLRRTRFVQRHVVATLDVFNFFISELKLPAQIVVDEAGALEPHVLEELTAQPTFVCCTVRPRD